MLTKVLRDFEEAACKLASVVRRTDFEIKPGWNEIIDINAGKTIYRIAIQFVEAGINIPEFWSVKVQNKSNSLSLGYTSFMSQFAFGSDVMGDNVEEYAKALESSAEHFSKNIKHTRRKLF
tara:strand:- start:232 stop:594 length:363 start_codon:yes stop_codon:yes gene_type:complete